jgi:hypothetical protein
MTRLFNRLLLAAVLVLFLSPPPSPVARAASSPDNPRFEREIRPLLEINCFSCHNSQVHSSGLVLETLDSILTRISFVIRFMAMFTVLTGLLVWLKV